MKPIRFNALSLLLILLVLSSSSLHADDQISFEKKYKDYQAIFLSVDFDVKVEEDYSYTTKARKVIKVLKEGGRQLGEIPISYDANRQEVRDLEAFTTTPDGKKHAYSKVQDFKVYAGFPMYSDLMVKVVSLPEVTVGSTLDQQFTLFSKGMPISGAFWFTLQLTMPIPTEHFRFSMTIPKKLGVKYKEFSVACKPKITEDDSNITYTWTISNLAPTITERSSGLLPMAGSMGDGVEFSTIESWNDVAAWYMNRINKNLVIDSDITKQALMSAGTQVSIRGKTRAILGYIQKNFRYVSMAFGDNVFEPHSTSDVFINKYGDCKDLSLLCIAMLKVVGVDSNLCLFNNKYALKDLNNYLPAPSLFNHALVMVRDPREGDFFVDPLLDGYDIDQYPVRYQGAYAFVITDNGGKIAQFPVFDEIKNGTSVDRTVTIGDDGSALVEIKESPGLDTSVTLRNRIKTMNDEEKERFYARIDSRFTEDGRLIDKRISGFDKEYGRIEIYVKANRPGAFPVVDDTIVIDVAGLDKGYGPIEKIEKDKFISPVNSMYRETIVFNLPKGYVVSEIPKDIDISSGPFNIKRQYKDEITRIVVIQTVQSLRKEVTINDYGKIRNFISQLPSATRQKIIIRKEDSPENRLLKILKRKKR